MKKILTTIVTATTVIMMAFASVFAADSSTGLVEITGSTDANGSSVAYTSSETTVPLLTPEIAASITGDSPSELTVVWQKDLSADTLPATFTFNANGTAGQTVYVFHFNGSAWELITTGVGPTVTATFTSLSPVSIVAKSTSASAPAVTDASTTSPATGDSMFYIALATLAVVGSAAFVVVTKKEA